MKVVNRLVLAVSFMFASVANANIIMSLDPSTQKSDVGSIVSVSVMIEGLGAGVQSTLAGFVLDVGFDSNYLSYLGYSLTDELGQVGPAFSGDEAEDWSWGYDGFDSVNLALFSNLLDDELTARQSSSFSLATLSFRIDTTFLGNSNLSLNVFELLSTGGQAPNLNLTQINNASVNVSAPATILLMVLGVLTMFVRQKRDSLAIKKS
jgi:hypothetical protein